MSTAKASAARWLAPGDRFFANVESTNPDDCWRWTGSTNTKGYGRFQVGGKRVGAHRWSYERHVGPIPEGLVIDHLCRNRACVNPDHLEAVTNAENVRRGEPANRTHCPHGHEYTPENTRIVFHKKRGRSYRRCRACNAVIRRRIKQRNRAARRMAALATSPDREDGAS